MGIRSIWAPVLCVLIAGCNTTELTESVLTFTGEEPGTGEGSPQEEILALLSTRLEEVLTPRGFVCEPYEVLRARGHTDWYTACRVADVSNSLQASDTWVNVYFPHDRGSALVRVSTGHVAFHPFTPSDKYFRKWTELVRSTVCGFGDFEVEHRWPSDSPYPISC